MKNVKTMFFILTLITLFVSAGAVCAVDNTNHTSVADNNPTDIATMDDNNGDYTVTDTAQTTSNDNKVDIKTIEKEEKNLKKDSYTISQSNYQDYFSTTGLTGIEDGDTLTIDGTIDIEQSIIIDKAVNINAINNGTITLNTVAEGYTCASPGRSFTINNLGSNTNITGVKFYNTQLFVKNATNITFDGINVTVNNQRIGSGVGITSIRENSHYVTVKNSYFETINNGGFSTLVLAGADNCIIDNNYVTAEGTVGNLIYLTTYNIQGIDVTDTNHNCHNIISNNTLYGPSQVQAICYGITLTGRNNTVINNQINYNGCCINSQWMSTDATNDSIGDNLQDYHGNKYINNTMNGSMTATKYSNITSNTIGTSLNTGNESILNDNTVGTTLNLQYGSTYTNTTFTSLIINGDYTLENIVISGSLTVNGTNNHLNNVTVNGIFSITGSNNFINDTHSFGTGTGEIKGSYNEIYNSEIASKSALTGSYNTFNNLTYNAGSINGNFNYINNSTITTTSLVMLKGTNNTINNSIIPKLKIMGNAINTTLDNVTTQYYSNSGINTTVLNQPSSGLNNINQHKNLKTDTIKKEGRKIEVVVDESNLEEVYIWGIFDFTTYCLEKYGDDSFEDVDELTIILKTSLPEGLWISTDINNNITMRIIGEGSVTINGLTTFDFRNSWSIYPNDIDLYIENVRIRQSTNVLESTGDYPIIVADQNCRIHMKNVSIIDVRNYNSITYDNMITSIFLNEKGNTFENCTMQFSYPTTNIDWSGNTDHPNLPLTIPIRVNSENNSFINNTVTFKETTTQDDFPTCWGFYVNKAYNLFEGNNIKMTGTGWLYAIDVRSTNNTLITNNIINTTSTAYGASIYIEGYNLINNTVSNNTIYTYAGMEYGSGNTPEQVIYPVCITDMAYQGGTYHSGNGNVWNNTIANNTIIGSANNIYGFEQFGGDNTIIANNTFNISGATPTGIGVIGVNSTIYNNVIHTSGLTNQTLTSADYLKPRTTGMYLYLSYNNTIFNNSIDSLNGRAISFEYSNGSIVENNTINTTNYTYTITFDNKSFNNSIQFNTLISTELEGDASVNNTSNNIVKNNLPKTEVKHPMIVITTTTFTKGENASISASIYSGDEILTKITNGKVTFKVNGKTLKDANGKIIYTKIINGTATIENYLIPDTWNDKSTIQAIYSGSTQCEKLTSEKYNITFNSEQPTITTENITAKTGDKITLKATITDNDKVINTGKIVFKINGKSVKDSDGTIIYLKVVNNQVELEYTLPESMKEKEYNLTATYISNDYSRLTDTKILTVKN